MAQSFLQFYYKNLMRSLCVPPSKEGNRSILQSLGVLGIITASCIGMGYTKQWIHADPLLIKRLRMSPPKQIDPSGDSNVTTQCRKNGATRVRESVVDSNETISILEFSQVFLRVLFVPSFCEEMIWRGMLLLPSTKLSICYICTVNSCYMLSHSVVHANVLSFVLQQCPPYQRRPIQTDNRKKYDEDLSVSDCSNTDTMTIEKNMIQLTSTTRTSIGSTIQVFTDPSFLFLSFVLGNVCTYSYIQAGYALYAPVLVHTIAVSIWLSFLGGNAALGRR